jgi:hypothetical protein
LPDNLIKTKLLPTAAKRNLGDAISFQESIQLDSCNKIVPLQISLDEVFENEKVIGAGSRSRFGGLIVRHMRIRR